MEEDQTEGKDSGARHEDLGCTALSAKVAMILRRLQGQGWETKAPPNSLQEPAGDSDPSRPQSWFLRKGAEWGPGPVDCESCSSMATVSCQEAPYQNDPGSGLASSSQLCPTQGSHPPSQVPLFTSFPTPHSGLSQGSRCWAQALTLESSPLSVTS